MSLALAVMLTLQLHAQAPSDWVHPRGDASLRALHELALPLPLQPLWSLSLGAHTEASPILVQGRVLIGAEDGVLRAFDLSSGKEVWKRDLGAPIGASAALVGSRVVLGDYAGTVHGLDPSSGAPLWRVKTGAKILGAANRLRQGRRDIALIGSYDAKVYAIDVSRGEVLWTHSTDNYVHGSPSVAEGLVVVGGCDGVVHVLDAQSGINAGSVSIGPQIGASIALVGTHAYFGHYANRFEAWDLDKGEVLWRYKDRAFPYFSSPAVRGDRVVFGGRDQRVHALDRRTGKLLWVHRTRGKVDASPVIAGQVVFIGSHDGRLRALDLSEGKVLWSHDMGAPISGSVAIAPGHLVVVNERGQLKAFRSEQPKPSSSGSP